MPRYVDRIGATLNLTDFNLAEVETVFPTTTADGVVVRMKGGADVLIRTNGKEKADTLYNAIIADLQAPHF